MDLVVFSWDFYPNTSGGAHARWRFCQIARSKGHDVTVFTPRGKGEPAHEIEDGIEIRRPAKMEAFNDVQDREMLSPLTRIRINLQLFWASLLWCYHNDPDGVHSDSHTLNGIAKLIALIYGIPLSNFVGFTPSLQESESSTADVFLESISFRYCMGEYVFCRNEEIAELAEKHSNGTVQLIHGVLNEERIRESVELEEDVLPATDDDERSLVFVGRLADIKNPEAAVAICRSLPENYRLYVIGDGPLRDTLESLTETDSKTHLLGRLDHHSTLKAIKEADGLVLTSRTESYPTVVFEGLSLSTPVFATPVGVLPAIDHPSLHLREVDQLDEAIEESLEDGVPRTERRQSSGLCEETLGRFSMENYTESILAAYGG